MTILILGETMPYADEMHRLKQTNINLQIRFKGCPCDTEIYTTVHF